MLGKLNKNTEKIQNLLKELGLDINVVEFSESTRSSQEAANAIGCDVGQIAKSIIFKGKSSQKPILVIASGVNRVNEKAIRELSGEKPEKADADFVLQSTGFIIGGVPPIGHKEKIKPYIDEDLLNYEEIWAAAGTPNSVFKITPGELVNITEGSVVSIK